MPIPSLTTFLSTLFGMAVFLALLAYLGRVYVHLWRTLAYFYPAPPSVDVLAKKFPEQVILAGGGLAFQSYVPLTVAVHESGISLGFPRPLSLACPAILLPFEEIQCRRTDWFLTKSAFAIRPAKVEIDVILWPSLWQWLQARCDLPLGPAATSSQERKNGGPERE